jgi:hypothetical protein
MPAPSSVEILDEYTALYNRLELIYKSYTLRQSLDSVMDHNIAHELLSQSTALVTQQADTEEIFRLQTGSNRLEEVFLRIDMPDTDRTRITRYAATIIDWHNSLETALTTNAPAAPRTGTLRRLSPLRPLPPYVSPRLWLPSAKNMSEVLATIGSRAELISKDCVRLAARLRESSSVALEFEKQMNGLSREFDYTRQRWRRDMERRRYPDCHSPLDIPNNTMSQLLRASGYGGEVFDQYRRIVNTVEMADKSVSKALGHGQSRGA